MSCKFCGYEEQNGHGLTCPQLCKCHCHGGYCIKDCEHPTSCEHCQPTIDEWGELKKILDTYCDDSHETGGHCYLPIEEVEAFIATHYIKKSTLFEAGERMKQSDDYESEAEKFGRDLAIDDLLSNFK